MKRIFVMLLDSFGIGASHDAHKYGDEGSDTFGHIAKWCAQGKADQGGRHGPLYIPNLNQLGLGLAAELSTGQYPQGISKPEHVIGAYGYAQEISTGKDTPSGHWEIAGVPVLFDWGYFTEHTNSFPTELLEKIYQKSDVKGCLGNCHSSGTTIIEALGEEHVKTGLPIFYTSADSVFQIAAHEEAFGLEKLYQLCELVREILTEEGYNIGRVIARPFVGNDKTDFMRTGNRHDYAVEPPSKTVLQKLVDEKQGHVVSVGKIADIYANTGITKKVKATGINALFDASLEEIRLAQDNTIVFTNFVDFDSSYGHRRDVAGYASALELFDRRLPEMLSLLQEEDVLILTADHGCDPTWVGSEHTREHIPVLIYGHKIKPIALTKSETFADIGQTIADYFSLSPMQYGQSLLPLIRK